MDVGLSRASKFRLRMEDKESSLGRSDAGETLLIVFGSVLLTANAADAMLAAV